MGSEAAPAQYGVGDTTFRGVGGETGVRHLVDAFYDLMSAKEEFSLIWEMHPGNNETSRDKLARFLCAWMGGPHLYREKYGPISIPGAHSHLNVTQEARDQWLRCMSMALEQMNLPSDLREYLLVQLAVPADRVVAVSAQARRRDSAGD